jgi:hypothetical protein
LDSETFILQKPECANQLASAFCFLSKNNLLNIYEEMILQHAHQAKNVAEIAYMLHVNNLSVLEGIKKLASASKFINNVRKTLIILFKSKLLTEEALDGVISCASRAEEINKQLLFKFNTSTFKQSDEDTPFKQKIFNEIIAVEKKKVDAQEIVEVKKHAGSIHTQELQGNVSQLEIQQIPANNASSAILNQYQNQASITLPINQQSHGDGKIKTLKLG